MIQAGANCTKCKCIDSRDSWVPPGSFNYSPKYLFVMEQYKTAGKRVLYRLLEECGFDTSECEVAFLTRCATGMEIKAQIREAQACSPLFNKLLAQVPETTIVIPMGATPCKVLTDAKSIQLVHGTVVEKDGRTYVPTTHPYQVVAYPESRPAFEKDIENLQLVGKGEVKVRSDCKYTFIRTMGEFKKMILHLWNADRFTFDIESSSLDPFKNSPHKPRVLGIAFSTAAKTGYWLPLQHKETPWTLNQLKTIVKFLKRLLEAARGIRIAHGGWYDVMYLWKVLGIRVANYLYDTLMMHYVGVSEELGTHGLKILAWEFTDMGGYDDALAAYIALHPEADPAQGGSYSAIPLKILETYAVQDADVTMRLYEEFIPKITERFMDLFTNIIMPGVHGLIDIVYNGAPIDREWWAHCNVEYPRMMKIELDRLREFPEVLELEREFTEATRRKKARDRVKRYQERSAEILEEFKTNPDRAAMRERRLLGDIERAKLKPVVVEPIVFNPKSPKMLPYLLFDKLGFVHTKRTKEGARSADKEVLKDLWQEHQHPVLMSVGRYVKLKTMYSMFVEKLMDMIGDDGRLRGRYNPAGTVTGRLSMAEPNLQQIPRKLKYDAVLEPFVDPTWPSIKKLFKARPGYVIMQFDYSQAELRILAALSQEPTLLQAYARGEDVHARVAAAVFKILIEEVTPLQRDRSKTLNFGLLYGQGAAKMAKVFRISLQEAKEFIAEYFRTLRKVKQWMNRVKATVNDTGESVSPYGRVRRLMSVFSPDDGIRSKAERQAVNSPIQATASDCTLTAVGRITRWLKANKMLSRVIITVHDSIVMEVKIEEMARVFKMVKKIMENPLNDGWLKNVKMVADGEGGPDWGTLTKIEKLEQLDSILPKAA